MVTRKDFLKNCAAAVCTAGMCGRAHAQEANASEDVSQKCNPGELTEIRNRSDAASLRFGKMIELVQDRLPEQDRKDLLHALGGKCADTYRSTIIDRYKGNLEGFLEEGRRLWMAEAHYDKAAGTIRIVDKSPTCSCPMVKQGSMPGSFCDCTLGWQEEAYSTILGRPVKSELEESILRGSYRCVYRIKIL
jgi:hypothetical protein